jgi:hypothetical protein
VSDDEAIAIVRVIASAEEFEEWAATRLLARLQLSVPTRDWFLLAARVVPSLRVWDPHAEVADECAD